MNILSGTFLGPLVFLGGLSFWAMFWCWRPIASALGISLLDRSASRRVIFRGVKGGSSLLQRKVWKCRLVFFGIYAAFFGLVFAFQGLEGFLYLLLFFALPVVLSRPFEVEGDQS